ncbi:MAG TPA: 23S rRNA (adenine(2503)-C(2))-methyltransferase RlmN [Bacteroidales bacterium]|nr:23S rRNA (adenine(2503)-C(2))-methyltransferase RlmN [Bacteroidales bacterium]
MVDTKKILFGLTLQELKQEVTDLGLPSYTAAQIAQWLYSKGVDTVEQMTNISLSARNMLQERFAMGLYAPTQVQVSKDGTKKYLFAVSQGRFVEAAYMPETSRSTLCVSTQVGCRMGCRFCMTATQGLQGNLTAGEILNQIRSLPERQTLTNIVYMGMGEPLDNLQETLKSLEILTSSYGFGMSAKRITVSTIGLLPALEEFLQKSTCNLAISLHSPFDSERQELMPMQKAHPIKEILEAIKTPAADRTRRISFEYIVFKGVNHSRTHANEIARILNGMKCRINLLRYHSLPNNPLQTPTEEDMQVFQQLLEQKGLITTIRKSRGQDIDAACGLLSTKMLKNKTLNTF